MNFELMLVPNNAIRAIVLLIELSDPKYFDIHIFLFLLLTDGFN